MPVLETPGRFGLRKGGGYHQVLVCGPRPEFLIELRGEMRILQKVVNVLLIGLTGHEGRSRSGFDASHSPISGGDCRDAGKDAIPNVAGSTPRSSGVGS
jgi:hypothetical protein